MHVLVWDRRLYPDDQPDELHASLARRLRQRIRPHQDPTDGQGFHS
jgi:hypothetical protein